MTARRLLAYNLDMSIPLRIGLALGLGVFALELRGQPAAPTRLDVKVTSGSMLIETSAPILNLLNRAEEGIAREDWKFAIDSLQRIIEDAEGSLVARSENEEESGGWFESARRLATRRLATLPPAGLEAYAILYDGKAKGLFERAREEHDTESLRLVVERYLLTQYGDDAADLLASWCLDEGRPSEALALLADVREFAVGCDVPEALLSLKLAAAQAMLGQLEEARAAASVALANGVDEQLDEVHAFSRMGGLSKSVDGSNEFAWSGVSRYRVMPPIQPTFARPGHEYRLSGAAVDWWRWIHDDDPTAPLVLPVGRLASDGRALFVRQPGGCAALDPDDLTMLWESGGPRSAMTARRTAVSAAQGAAAARSAPERSVEDYIGESLSSAHGLVLLVERGGLSPRRPANRFGGQVGQVQQREQELATRLTAYDAQSGKIRWRVGTFDGPADWTGAVFRAPPIAVGEELWVPFFRQNDYFLGILNPSDGLLVRTVLLGSLRQLLTPLGPATPPAYVDGMVFVPSGYGTLFAVDAQSRTVRWARQYDHAGRARSSGVFASTKWIPAEPLVTGGMVILPPVDHRELVALSTASGEIRWAVSVDGGAYLIAAESDRLWVGGRGIHCLSPATGELLWQTHLIAAPTGSAVLCGGVIFVPTAAGLLSLDAADGAALQLEALHESRTPFGNLFCSQTGLYSLDPTSLRRQPDLDRTYALAQSRYEVDPKDPSAAARLAAAELLRENPARAWTLLEPLASRELASNPMLTAKIARLGVEALLGKARAEHLGSARAMEWLDVADKLAADPAERMKCDFERAEQHIAAGRLEQAYSALAEFGLSEDGDGIVPVAESVDAEARVEVRRRLAQLEERLSQSEREGIESKTAQWKGASRSRLRAVAELYAASPVGQRALLALAGQERERWALEKAEIIFRESSRRTADPLLTALSLVELCGLYSDQEWMNALGPCLTDLEARVGAVTFDSAGDIEARIARGQRVADWVAEVRAVTPVAGATVGQTSRDPTLTTVLTSETAWTWGAAVDGTPGLATGRLVHFDDDAAPALRDRVLTLRQDGLLESVGSADGKLLWETNLRLPGNLTDSPAQNVTDHPRFAVVDGQVAVFNHTDGLYAVGLLTGRRLWVRPFEVIEDPTRAHLHDRAMAAGYGLLAAMPREGRLTLMRLTDGSTTWERDLRGEIVDRVWMADNRVLTSDGAGERVQILDRSDGSLIKLVLFRQAKSGGAAVRLVRTGGRIIGPDLSPPGGSVVAIDERTGEEAWRIQPELPVHQLFKPQEGYVGISCGQGLAQVVDVATGDVVIERQVPGGRTVGGGVLIDGTLVLRADGVRKQSPAVELHAFDVATGEPVWHREDLWAVASIDDPIPLHEGVIPALSDVRKPEVNPSGVATTRTRTALVLVNARTGQDAGAAVDITTQGTAFNGTVVMRGGAIIVGTTRGVQAFRTQQVPRPDVEGNY
jgi:outer membrane protein assembly factor BamB/predicted negative regulator of RcsB-dependent stress response